jgi:hypothetical protein
MSRAINRINRATATATTIPTTIAVVFDAFWVAGTVVDVVEVVEVDVVDVGALVAGVVVAGVVVGAVVVAGDVVGVVSGLAVVGASVVGGATVVVAGSAPARAKGKATRRPNRAVTMTTPEALRVIVPRIGASAPSTLS